MDKNQVIVQESKIAKTTFSLMGFPDFLAPEKQRDSVSRIDESKLRDLKSVVEGLGAGATLTVAAAPRYLVLECADGWKVTIVKGDAPIRGSVIHNGSIEKVDGSAYDINEVREVLRGLHYFLAFVACRYCHPTVVVGYDSHRRPVWGKVGRFEVDWLAPINWFNNVESRKGAVLEQLFPKFWTRWREHKNEIVAVVECYVHSYAMRKAGISNDAVAKSYTGLNLLSSLQHEKEVKYPKDIKKTLSRYQVPYVSTDVVRRISDHLGGRKRQGVDLLNRVRNYIAHPLEGGTPVKVKQEPLKYLGSEPLEYVYLHDLSQFYLEYMFLAYCGLPFERHRPLLENNR